MQTPQTVDEIGTVGYVWRFKPIRFNGCVTTPTPQRESNTPDSFDLFFTSKEAFKKWFRSTTVTLAELDESMNYCKYFQRDKGNTGYYVREGKSFPVDGSWVGIQDFDNYAPCQPFVAWLKANNWRDTWFELMDRYK